MAEEWLIEIIDRVLKAEPDLVEDGEEYLERTRIVRIIRGMDDGMDKR